MAARKITAIIIATAALLATIALSVIPVKYMSEYGGMRSLSCVAMLIGGIAVAAIVYRRVMAVGTCRRNLAIVICVALSLVLLPFFSMLYPGRVIYSRFGLTVYGIVPVPLLDIKIGSRGLLWFRDKTHKITIDEARSLLSADTEVLIIGTGWDSAATVDPKVKDLQGVRVEILATPDAFTQYNKYKSEGRRVVLIAHSSC